MVYVHQLLPALFFLSSWGDPCGVHASRGPPQQRFEANRSFAPHPRLIPSPRGGANRDVITRNGLATGLPTSHRRFSLPSTMGRILDPAPWKVLGKRIHHIDYLGFKSLPLHLREILTSRQWYAGIVAATTVAISLSLFRHIHSTERKRIEYLIWDAKELIPKAWEDVENQLSDENITSEDEVSTMTALQSRKDLQASLLKRINEAKARQVASIYTRYFPQEWTIFVSNSSNSDPTSTDGVAILMSHPKVLRKMTRRIYQQKFVALLRPDYAFGIGRNGIDLVNALGTSHNSDTKISSRSNQGMLNSQLLQQVTEDLILTCPLEHPQLWKNYTAKLRPGQTLWDRHDLVLKMVKSIQVKKKRADGILSYGSHSAVANSDVNGTHATHPGGGGSRTEKQPSRRASR